MKTDDMVVHRDPEVLGGTPVFVGTRVPVKRFLITSKGDTHWMTSWMTFQR